MTDIKKEIYRPIGAAVIIILAFYAIEIPMVLLNVFPHTLLSLGRGIHHSLRHTGIRPVPFHIQSLSDSP